MRDRLEPLEGSTISASTHAFTRTIEPVAQVPVRASVAGPQRFFAKVQGGVDLRGDGSAEAWTGRVNKDVVSKQGGESAIDALRRTLTA
jgi:hypothetical protein